MPIGLHNKSIMFIEIDIIAVGRILFKDYTYTLYMTLIFLISLFDPLERGKIFWGLKEP